MNSLIDLREFFMARSKLLLWMVRRVVGVSGSSWPGTVGTAGVSVSGAVLVTPSSAHGWGLPGIPLSPS